MLSSRVRILSGLALLAVVGWTSTCRSEAVLQGTYEGKHYEAGGREVILFGGKFAGQLTVDQVNAGAREVLQKVLANPNRGSVSTAFIDDPELGKKGGTGSIRRGEIFVYGWYSPSTNTWGWIALDSNGDAYPLHNWITNGTTLNGPQRGRVDSNGSSIVCSNWAIHGTPVELRVAPSAGWIRMQSPKELWIFPTLR